MSAWSYDVENTDSHPGNITFNKLNPKIRSDADTVHLPDIAIHRRSSNAHRNFVADNFRLVNPVIKIANMTSDLN